MVPLTMLLHETLSVRILLRIASPSFVHLMLLLLPLVVVATDQGGLKGVKIIDDYFSNSRTQLNRENRCAPQGSPVQTILPPASVDALFEISVKEIRGKEKREIIHKFNVNPSDTIQSVRNKVHWKFGVPPELQRLVVAGEKDTRCLTDKQLKDGKTIADYDMKVATTGMPTLHLVQRATPSFCRAAPARNAINIKFINAENGESFIYPVRFEGIHLIRKKIFDKLNIKVANQLLTTYDGVNYRDLKIDNETDKFRHLHVPVIRAGIMPTIWVHDTASASPTRFVRSSAVSHDRPSTAVRETPETRKQPAETAEAIAKLKYTKFVANLKRDPFLEPARAMLDELTEGHEFLGRHPFYKGIVKSLKKKQKCSLATGAHSPASTR